MGQVRGTTAGEAPFPCVIGDGRAEVEAVSGPAGGRLDGRTTLVNLAAKTVPETGRNFSIASGERPDIGRKFG